MSQKIQSVSNLYPDYDPSASSLKSRVFVSSVNQFENFEERSTKELSKFLQIATYLTASKMFISALLIFAMLTGVIGVRFISQPTTATAAIAAINTKFVETPIVPAGQTIKTINFEDVVIGTPQTVPGGIVTLNTDGTMTIEPNDDLVGELNIPYQVSDATGVLTDLAVKNTISSNPTAPLCTLSPSQEYYSMYRNDILGAPSSLTSTVKETIIRNAGPNGDYTRRILTLTVINNSTTDTFYNVKYPITNFYGRGVETNTAVSVAGPGNFEKAFYDAAGNYFEVPTSQGLELSSPGYRFQVENNTQNPQNTTAKYEPISSLPNPELYLVDKMNVPNNTQVASQIVPVYYLPDLAPGQSTAIKISFLLENMPVGSGIEYFGLAWDDTVIAQKEQCTSKLELIKTGTLVDINANGFTDAGDKVNYNFTVKNTGSLVVNNIKINDPKITVTGGPIATLAVGATDSTTFTGTQSLTADQIASGSIENSAVVEGTDSTGKPVTDISDSDDSSKVGLDDPTIVNFIKAPEVIPPVEPPIEPKVIPDPLAINDFNNTAMNSPITYNPLINDRNAEGAVITAINGKPVIVGVPIVIENGTVTLNEDGTITVTPDKDFLGTLLFTYDIKTPEGKTATGTNRVKVDNVKIALDKAATLIDTNGDGVSQVGETINYTFIVKNIGDLPLIDFRVIDPLVEIKGELISQLSAGQTDSTTFSATHTLTQADIDAGKFENQAVLAATDSRGKMVVATSNDPSTTQPEDITIVKLLRKGTMELIKTGVWNDVNSNGYTDIGDKIDYTFKVTNTGNVDISDIMVTDSKITVNGTLPLLPVGAIDTTSFTGTYNITAADIEAGKVDNSATATGKGPDGKPVIDTSDSNDNTKPGSDDPTTVVLVPMPLNPSMTLDKDGTLNDDNKNGQLDLGEKITYKFTVKNTGNTIITDIKIADPLAGIVITGGPINLNPGDVDSTTFTAYYITTQKDIDTGFVKNQATATGKDPKGNSVIAISNDPKTTNPNDATVIPLAAFGKIEVIKLSQLVDNNNDGYSSVGDSIKYSFAVKNQGAVTLSNVTISDNKANVVGGPIATLAPNQTDTTTFTATYLITQADIIAGKVENSALAKATDPKGNEVSDTSDSGDATKPGSDDPTVTILVPMPLNPSMTLDKDGTLNDDNKNGQLDLGEKITYKFTVKNTGNTIITDIKIADPLAGIVITGGPINLNPGDVDSTTFTAYYITTQKDIDTGFVKNQATATGKDPKGNSVIAISNDPKTNESNDPTVIPLSAVGKIEVIKLSQLIDANNDGYSSVGDYIKYFFGVKNLGGVTLTNVTISDSKANVTGGPIAILAPNQTDTTTFQATYMITQADVDSGKVENSAIVKAKDPKGNEVSDTSDSGDATKPGKDDPTVTILIPKKPAAPILPMVLPPIVFIPTETVRTGAGFMYMTTSVIFMLSALFLLVRKEISVRK